MLRIEVEGVTVRLDTEESSFERYVRGSYGPACATTSASESRRETDINVHVDFHRFRGPLARAWLDRVETENPVILGSHLRVGDGSVFYQYGPYCIEALKSRNGIEVRALFQMTRRHIFLKMLGNDEILESYQALMRQSIHYPLFHALQEKGFSVLHANLVEKDGDGVLFIGANGAGKTTAALALLPEARILADNFVLFDGNNLVGFPEYIRVSKEAAEAHGLKTTGMEIFGKRQVGIGEGALRRRARPAAGVIVRRGTRASWKEIEREKVIRYLDAVDSFLHEGHKYSYIAFPEASAYRTMYPECSYFEATLGGFEESKTMIREKVGGLIGL